MDLQLTGKKALVTGGTRGIGMMMARGLLQAGARVIISSRKADACESARQELSQFGDVTAIPADLSRHDECLRLADLVTSGIDGLHILVNNAGATWGEPLESFPDSAWDRVLDLNLKSPFWLTQALLPVLREGGTADDPARIINGRRYYHTSAFRSEEKSYPRYQQAQEWLDRVVRKRHELRARAA